MVLERQILPYLTWLLGGDGVPSALVQFIATIVILGVLALVAGFCIALVRHGPLKGGVRTYRRLAGGVSDLLRISPRRVLALAGLAIKESLRRRVLIALAVFGLILVFASWFLQTDHREPAKLYLSFVLTATTYLVLLIALLLSAFSIPNDIRSKTIYTIVTKPVRAGDIVLGRILGFTAIGTLMLVAMGAASYLFVQRELSHTHEVDLQSISKVTGPNGEDLGVTGRTTSNNGHRHEFSVGPEGVGETSHDFGHWHPIVTEDGALTVEAPPEIIGARVPLRGSLRFRGRNGEAMARGISVGAEWTYRSYIEGGSQAAAIWTFNSIDESDLVEEDGAQYLPLELIVRVFRTYVGDVETAIEGAIQLRNPETGLKSDLDVFSAKDFAVNNFNFPRELVDSDGQPIDLLNDLVNDGKIEVWVSCLDRQQYFGFAQADCYIRLPDGSPVWNFTKAYVSIWVQMVIVISIGVAASTFLSGPIAMMFTVAFIVLGFFKEFFVKVATIEAEGGGPLEALVRIVTQRNLTSRFDESFAITLMKWVDEQVLGNAMRAVALVLPDFRSLDTVTFVAQGFSIPADAVGRELTICLAYVIGLSIAGYFCLRSREVAK